MSASLTTTEHAAVIRDTLKRDHGWTSRQVSVRAEYFSLGSSITVIVKDPAIPLPVIKAIAEQAERIRRDGFGEILGGGNRYVSVSYNRETLAIMGRRYADAVQRAVQTVAIGSPSLATIEGTPFFVGRPDDYRFTLWEDSYLNQSNTVDGLAEIIGALMIARECQT